MNLLTGHCTDQCMKKEWIDIEVVRKEALTRQKFRNNKNEKVNWQFTTEDAKIEFAKIELSRISLSRIYQTLEN